MQNDKFLIEDEDGTEIELPTKWEICTVCRGNGQHAHAIDGNGITASEWAEWDCEEREDYLRGNYDSVCDDCGGSGKVREVDEAALNPETLKLWIDWSESIAQMRAEEAAERRMGA